MPLKIFAVKECFVFIMNEKNILIYVCILYKEIFTREKFKLIKYIFTKYLCDVKLR